MQLDLFFLFRLKRFATHPIGFFSLKNVCWFFIVPGDFPSPGLDRLIGWTIREVNESGYMDS